ncbi:hypothetical protein NUU61_004366 [Penicillium alfredii]|uniref:Uncharacterized protein n=1 Tax=Penicillium alfredii TaxID=1506179 RepID=A0A9W9FKZ1_9EURO|nr:uncharacterized protein NUU61_004366 [Penicillium alfredii]KAJ5102144.1 hypothetical protein NUU61_004366 [Penicillium alfredii]
MTEVPNISTSALVAHMESSSRSKYAIRLYDDFNDYIERSTGGLIQVDDYREDGTARLVARDLETLDRDAVWKDPGKRPSQEQPLLEF